jgi:hypothetical protein
VQTLQAAGDSDEHSRARSALNRRWQDLLCGERLYRSPSRQAAAG